MRRIMIEKCVNFAYILPDITSSSLYLYDELSKFSAVIGIGSTVSPSNLYMAPLSDGIIRTHCPLLVNSRFCMLDEIIGPGIVLIVHLLWPSFKMSNAEILPSNVET